MFYTIHGIAVISTRPRLYGTGRMHRHLSGGDVEAEAKMNFERTARRFRFTDSAMASIWTKTYCEPLIYAQLGHASHRIRVAFIHPVPTNQPKQQSFL